MLLLYFLYFVCFYVVLCVRLHNNNIRYLVHWNTSIGSEINLISHHFWQIPLQHMIVTWVECLKMEWQHGCMLNFTRDKGSSVFNYFLYMRLEVSNTLKFEKFSDFIKCHEPVESVAWSVKHIFHCVPQPGASTFCVIHIFCTWKNIFYWWLSLCYLVFGMLGHGGPTLLKATGGPPRV